MKGRTRTERVHLLTAGVLSCLSLSFVLLLHYQAPHHAVRAYIFSIGGSNRNAPTVPSLKCRCYLGGGSAMLCHMSYAGRHTAAPC